MDSSPLVLRVRRACGLAGPDSHPTHIHIERPEHCFAAGFPRASAVIMARGGMEPAVAGKGGRCEWRNWPPCTLRPAAPSS